MNAEPPNRSWLRFSLRTLLISITLLAAFLGWFTVKFREANGQRAAVAEIIKRGNSVKYDQQAWTVYVGEKCPRWLYDRLGPDFFARVVSANIHDDWADAELFSACPRLTELHYWPVGITEEVLSKLGKFNQLETLHIRGARITDTGLAQIAGLRRLKKLDIHDTAITDDGLAHLKGLTRLEWLDVNNERITDAGLEHLAGLKQLRWLDVSLDPITVAGLKKLQQALPNCEIAPLSTNVRAPPMPPHATK